jgi:hypothetical protein
MISLAHDFDFDHHARDVPGQRGKNGVSSLAIRYNCDPFVAIFFFRSETNEYYREIFFCKTLLTYF